MTKLSLFIQTLNCSAAIESLVPAGNAVSFTVTVHHLPEDFYQHILVKFGLQGDVIGRYSYDSDTTVILVDISRLLIDEAINDMLSA